MKILGTILLSILLIVLMTYFFTYWWWILIVPFLIMLLYTKRWIQAFLISFLVGSLTWGVTSVYKFMNGSEIILNRMTDVFSLPNGLITMLAITILGGLLAGFAGATGASLRSILFGDIRKKSYY